MKKRELAEKILDDLIDEGMIILECGQEFWQEGKVECVNVIYDRLKDFYIIEGREIED